MNRKNYLIGLSNKWSKVEDKREYFENSLIKDFQGQNFCDEIYQWE